MTEVPFLCLFAVFAQREQRFLNGLDLIGIYPEISFDGDDVDGWSKVPARLYVQLMAPAGVHTLSCPLPQFDSMLTAEFEIRPEDDGRYLAILSGEFPVLLRNGVQAYPLLLDGQPLTTVYLAVSRRKETAG